MTAGDEREVLARIERHLRSAKGALMTLVVLLTVLVVTAILIAVELEAI